MHELLLLLLKISLGVFMASNLLGMGLKLRISAAFVGLQDFRFLTLSLLWCFVLGPGCAYLLVHLFALEKPYAVGLILISVSPCAPFLPMVVERARGDLEYTASFMLLAAVGLVIYMPLVVPVLIAGLEVSAWTIARPLLSLVLVPLLIGMAMLHFVPLLAGHLQPIVKKTAGIATIVMLGLCGAIYGGAFLSLAGSFAVLTQLLFYGIVTVGSYACAWGLQPSHKSVLSLGVCTRNLGAAFAPLFAVSGVDERAVVMVALGAPLQIIAAFMAANIIRSRFRILNEMQS